MTTSKMSTSKMSKDNYDNFNFTYLTRPALRKCYVGAHHRC
jgi:hypothetical protein